MESVKQGWGIFVKINGKEQLVGLVSKRKNALKICSRRNERGPRHYTYEVLIKENMNEQDGVQTGPTTEETEEPVREEGIDVGPSTGKEEESSVARRASPQADKTREEAGDEGFELGPRVVEIKYEDGRTTVRHRPDEDPSGYAGLNTHEANTDKP